MIFNLKNNHEEIFEVAEGAFVCVCLNTLNLSQTTILRLNFKSEWDGIMPKTRLSDSEFKFAFKIVSYKTLKTIFNEDTADEYTRKVLNKFNEILIKNK